MSYSMGYITINVLEVYLKNLIYRCEEEKEIMYKRICDSGVSHDKDSRY